MFNLNLGSRLKANPSTSKSLYSQWLSSNRFPFLVFPLNV